MKQCFSETFKITSSIVSEVRISAAVQPNDQRLLLNVGYTWSGAIVRRTSTSIKRKCVIVTLPVGH